MSKYIEFYQTPISVLDLRFLKIDASNDPITGDLTINANLLFDGTRKIIGGTTTTSDFTLQTTSGVGVTGADMHFLVGNNGGTEAMTILNNGNVGIGTIAPTSKLSVQGTTTTASLGTEKVVNGNFLTNPDTSWVWGTGWVHDTTNFEADYTGTTGAIATVANGGIKMNHGGSWYLATDVL